MIRENFIGMDDRLWTPEEWAAWLRYVERMRTMSGRDYKTAVNRQKDSRLVKYDTKS